MADEHTVGARAGRDVDVPDLDAAATPAPAAPVHRLEQPPYGIVPEGDTLGVRHIAVALQDLPFPATGRELLARAGHWRIPVTGSHMHPLSEFLAGVPLDRRFRAPEDVARAVEKAWKRR